MTSALTPIPSAPAGADCNPSLSTSLGTSANVTAPYCQFNWPSAIPNLSDCCNDDAQVLTFENCTQYCESDLGAAEWRECIAKKVPEADAGQNLFTCVEADDDDEEGEAETGTGTVSMTTVTETGTGTGTGSPTMTGGAEASQTTGVEESTGAAHAMRPPATFMQWVVTFGAVLGARFA